MGRGPMWEWLRPLQIITALGALAEQNLQLRKIQLNNEANWIDTNPQDEIGCTWNSWGSCCEGPLYYLQKVIVVGEDA